MNNTGFVAGTLIHTDKGLVPIQDIKVGDMVLSRDEHNPDGDTVYKRVVSTFKSNEKKPVMAVEFFDEKLAELSDQFYINRYEVLLSGTYDDYLNYYNDDPEGKLYDQRLKEHMTNGNKVLHHLEKNYQLDTTLEVFGDQGINMHLFCTDDHPFWVDGKGWTLASEMNKEDNLVSGIDLNLVIEMGSFTSAEECKFLYQTNVPDLASYLYYDSYENYQTHLETVERFVDFRPSVPTFTYGITDSKESLGKNIFGEDIGMTYFNTSIHPESAYHPLEAIYKLPTDIDDPEWDGIRQPHEVAKPNELQFNYGSKFHNPSQEKYDRYEAYVYNIEVEDYHTYFVGYAGVWVAST